MGYFSNGEEGCVYEERFCKSCVHWDDYGEKEPCAVWMLHLEHNYNNDYRILLNELIPRDGTNNLKCKMHKTAPGESIDRFVDVDSDTAKTWWIK